MNDRYSFNGEGPARCGICGGQVFELTIRGVKTITDARPPMEVRRTCQNPKCPSNTGEASLTDEV